MTLLNSDSLPGISVPSCRDGIRAQGRTRLSCFSCISCGSFRALVGLLLIAIILGAQPQLAHAQTTATYDVTFKGNWTTSSTNVAVPGSAHFTTLIGAVHNSDVTFWAVGGTATAGVENVAELGSTGTFRSEINNAASGNVKSIVQGSPGSGPTGMNTFEVEFSRTHPLLTLLSMIGPSPDWFVGVNSLSMLDGSDAWRSSHTVDLFAYDAGTENGENFSLNNPATSPRGTITSLRNMGKFTNVRMARLTFTLKQQMNTNNAPEFSGTRATRSFTETVGDATVQSAGNVGAVITATDDDNDILAYTLEGTDAARFTVDSSGQIKTKVGSKYDREAKGSYSVTVKADDQNGGTDTIAVTINVDNATEKPLKPARPVLSSGSTTSVSVMWNAPSNTGRPPIISYDLRYREGMTGDWMDGPQGVTGTRAVISSLAEATEYQVQVLASNSDGDGPWSDPGTGRTDLQGNTNTAPEFPGPSTTRSFTETVGDATVQSAGNVGTVVTATDVDNNMLAYTLEGVDKDEFTIDSSGQIRTKVGKSYDRETKPNYSVMVKADDGNGGTATIAVTISVADEAERPLAPAAPSVSPTNATSVNVTWNAPSNVGRPAITHYDLQYKKSSDSNWSDGPQDVTAMSRSIGSLEENTEYQVQVLASNSDGDGPWSAPGAGRTNRAPVLPPPATEARQVDTDGELMEFVEDAAQRIEASDTFQNTLVLLEEFRDREKGWNDGSMYLVLLTRGGGVYFHAKYREVEDLDWSGVLSCEGGGAVLDTLDTRQGCFIEYGGDRSGYAHPFSASHVPLAHGKEEFVLLGGFDETPEGNPFTGVIEEPSTEAGEVDTDNELREFVGHAGRALMGAIVNPEIDPAELRGILRQEGSWREGEVYIYIMDETGRVIFDGEDRGREQRDESLKRYVRDIIDEAGQGIVEYRDGGLLRRGYAVEVMAPLDGDEPDRAYIVGSGYRVEEEPGGSASGGGCAVVGNSSGGASGLLLVTLALLLAVSLRSAGVLPGACRLMSAAKPCSLPKRNKRSGFCGEYSPRDV